MDKYTKDADGVERATINVPFRVTREEAEKIRHWAANTNDNEIGVLSDMLRHVFRDVSDYPEEHGYGLRKH